jgi:ATP:corrinoid adenosyltransferase
MIQAICNRFPMMTVMKRVKSRFKRIVESWDFEGDLTKEFGKDAKAAVRRIMDVEEVENVIVDEIVACLKWESLKARAISRILQNEVEAHPLIELMGDRHWT